MLKDASKDGGNPHPRRSRPIAVASILNLLRSREGELVFPCSRHSRLEAVEILHVYPMTVT